MSNIEKYNKVDTPTALVRISDSQLGLMRTTRDLANNLKFHQELLIVNNVIEFAKSTQTDEDALAELGEQINHALRGCLNARGYENIKCFNDGQSLFEYVKFSQPALIFFRLAGHWLSEQMGEHLYGINRIAKNTLIVIIHELDDDKVIKVFKNINVFAFVQFPVDFTAFEDVLEQALHTHQLADNN